MLGVSRQGFYQWRDRPPSRRALYDAELTERIKKIHTAHGRRVGVRRVRDELARAGVVCSHKRTHRLMRTAGLRGVHPKPYKQTTMSGRFDPSLVDLLQRDWSSVRPDLAWVGDITYIKTWTGWAFLATVIDCFSRKVIGFAIADHMRTDLIIDALRMAITHRRPLPGTVFHSDYAEVLVKPRNQRLRWAAACLCQIPRLNDSRSSQAVEGVQCVFGQGLTGGVADCWVGGVDGGAHHINGGECVEGGGGRRVFVAEEPHNNRQWDAMLVEVHGLGFAQHVAVNPGRHRGAGLSRSRSRPV